MFDISNLSAATTSVDDPSRFWWIDKKLLIAPKYSIESLTMSAPIANKLSEALTGIVKDLVNKSDYVFAKTKDVFGFRLRLEQMYRTVQNSKVSWESLANVDVLGFDFVSCQNRLANMEKMAVYVATSIQRSPIEIVDEMPNLSDEDIVASINDLKMTVNAGKVKFFSGTTRKGVLSAVDNLIAFDKSVETMAGYSQNVVTDTKTYSKPIAELTKNETVDVNDVHAAVDEVNKRITTVNHLLNAMFLLQSYNKVMNVIFTDAISNLKEG